jgi:hypothetical protein
MSSSKKNINKYNKSNVLNNTYEAEGVFPAMGSGEWLSFTAAPIFDGDQEITGAVETLIIISGHKYAERKLVDSQQKYRELSTIAEKRHLSSIPANTRLSKPSQRV